MAIVFNHTADEIYNGALKIGTSAAYPGDVVYCDDSAGTAIPVASNAVGDGYDLAIVANYDPYADTDGTDSEDYNVAVGKYARLKFPKTGDILTTDRFIGTYADVAVDSVFVVNCSAGAGTVGKWIVNTDRASAKLTAKVIEKTTLYGNNALKMRVLSV